MILGDLTNNFSSEEFACGCGCGVDTINMRLVLVLQAARDRAGIPISINSGYRCPRHNEAKGGSEDSEHLFGNGVDVRCDSSRLRFILISCALEAGLSRIGVKKGMVHLGVSCVHEKEVVWLYD